VLYAPEFESFWALYPRKEPSKRKAFEAWSKANSRASPAEIEAGLKRWLPIFAACEPDKVPHATTFLNQDRWEVERPTSRAQPRASPDGRLPNGKLRAIV